MFDVDFEEQKLLENLHKLLHICFKAFHGITDF